MSTEVRNTRTRDKFHSCWIWEERVASKSERYYYGTGRRKTAVARVRLFAHEGPVVVNGRPFEEFFPVALHRQYAVEPIESVGGDFCATVKVSGGGIAGQAGAVRHGLARALLEFNPELRAQLKKAGFLTRDARAKERKKPGLKRARKAPQYTKR